MAVLSIFCFIWVKSTLNYLNTLTLFLLLLRKALLYFKLGLFVISHDKRNFSFNNFNSHQKSSTLNSLQKFQVSFQCLSYLHPSVMCDMQQD